MPRVSVIIPCYNQGRFLEEAVACVLCQTFTDLEIIIVNDGSDEPETVSRCNSYDDPRISVLNTANQGLAAARNNGIRAARGEYILPLDADDRIGPPYLAEAVNILEADGGVGIVYCRARLFGAVDGDWQLPDYSLEEMLKDNVIFCTAMFRKNDWEAAGGYDTALVHGWEDYDFWLTLIERGCGVHRLEGRYFYYRVAPESMVRAKGKAHKVEMFKRIFQRHWKLFSDHIEVWLDPLLDLREPYLTCRLYVDCGSGLSDDSSVARKIEPGRRTIRFPLHHFTGIQALRFDPADRPASVEIESVMLRGEGEAFSLDPTYIGANADFIDGSRFLFSTADPQIYFDVDAKALVGVCEVIITINLICHGDEALRDVIAIYRKREERPAGRFSLLKMFRSRRG